MAQHKNDHRNNYLIATSGKNRTATAGQHSLDTSHKFKFHQSEILCSESVLSRRLTKEIALIKKSETKKL